MCQKAVIFYAMGQCRYGNVLVAEQDHAICAVLLGQAKASLQADLQLRFAESALQQITDKQPPFLTAVIDKIEQPDKAFSYPVAPQGTAFQQLVWQALQNIPCGETATYSEIARQMGRPKAYRAVANACAKNAVSILIPCHRVVHKDGGLSGYYWGPELKAALLNDEKKMKA